MTPDAPFHVHLHITHAVPIVDAFISHRSAEWVTVYSRIVDVANDLVAEALVVLSLEAKQIVHYQVGGLHVLQPIRE